jgi:lipopolysaccharide transport system permease protein
MEASMSKVAEPVPPREPSPTTPASDAATDPAEGLPVTLIERKPGWHLLDLGELWRFRELLFFLTWRDIKIRYKQTVLGAAWAVLQPFATMVVFCLFFSHVAAVAPGTVPYPLFVFIGLVPWFFFANAIASASQSVIGNQNLVTKIYFPRLIIPMAAVGAGLIDFVIAFSLVAGLMLYYWIAPGFGLLLAPVLFVGLVIAAVGVGTLLSALTVAYRDFRYVVPFMVQLWMFATPAVYMEADTVVGPQWRPLLALNPACGLIANFRAAVLGTALDPWSMAVSSAVSVALLLLGCFYFRRVERSFADII